MTRIGDLIIIKKPPQNGWTGFISDSSPDNYDYHKRCNVFGPQFGTVIDVRKWHVHILPQDNSAPVWLPTHAIKEISR